MQLVLIGNYGVDNFGDEALKHYFVTRFPELDWAVVSARPMGSAVPRLPFGLRSLVQPWWMTLRAFWRSDAVVFGGGSLFTDSESVKACLLWWWHAFVAWMFRKPVILAFQGVGPFQTRVGEWCARWVLRRAGYVSVRDEASFQRVRKWTNTKIVQSFDPVFSLFQAKKSMNSTRKLIIIPRGNSSQNFFDRCREIASQGWDETQVVLLDCRDRAIVAQLEQWLGQWEVLPVRSLGEFEKVLMRASFVLTQRYHGAIAALAMGIPFEVVPQRVGDKLAEVHRVDLARAEELWRNGEKTLRDFLKFL